MGKQYIDSASSAAAANIGPRPAISRLILQKGSFKGVRRRSWGKWVSEIRMPRSRERTWPGSFASPVQAARAFDAAAMCLRGLSCPTSSSPLNLPHLPTPRPLLDHYINSSSSLLHPPVHLSKKDIQSIAAAAAADIDSSEYTVDPPSLLNYSSVHPEKLISHDSQEHFRIFHPDCPSQLQLEALEHQAAYLNAQ